MEDDWIRAICKILESQSYEDYYFRFGIVHKDPTKELVVVPMSMEREIIEMAHRQGYFASKKIADLIEKTFYIPRLKPKVEGVVKSCVECIMTEAEANKKLGLLNPTDIADKLLMTKRDTICHICNIILSPVDRVADHCHLTGKYRGPAHSKCNLEYQIEKFIYLSIII